MQDDQKFIKQSEKSFNMQAKGYDHNIFGKHAKSMYKYVLEKLEKLEKLENLKNVSILDVGFGTGNILNELAQRYDNNGVKLSGLDLSEEMFAKAKEKLGDRADLRLGNSEQLPWIDNTFDYVLCTDSFHHYPNPEVVLAEMKRVLKSEGVLIIAEGRAPSIIQHIINFFIRHHFSPLGDYKLYFESEMEELFESSGFIDVMTEYAGKRGYITSAKAP